MLIIRIIGFLAQDSINNRYQNKPQTSMDKPIWKNKMLKFHIYDQKLKLVYSGRVKPESNQSMQYNLNQCSLLFNIENTGYFLTNS